MSDHKMARTLAIAGKEWRQILRDPRTLFLAILLPVLLILLLGYAINLDIDNIPLGIVDLDRTATSRNLTAALAAGNWFTIRAQPETEDEAQALLGVRRIRIAIVIPQGFARSLARGETARIQALADGSDSSAATIAGAYLDGLVRAWSSAAVPRQVRPLVTLEPRFLFNPELESRRFILPGLLVVVIAIISVLLTTLSIAREYERGTMEQLMTTPVRPPEIVVGKALPYIGIGLVQTFLALLVIIFIFECHPVGNPLVLFVYSIIFQFSAICLGLFFSALLRVQVLAMQIGILAAFLPTFLLAGFVFPVDSMPGLIQAVSAIVPAKYFLIIIRDVFIKGQVWHVVPSLILFLFSLVLVIAASRKIAKGAFK